jgi:hypothetical protein
LRLHNCQCLAPHSTYQQVDCGEEALCYILVLQQQPIHVQVCEGIRILQSFGEYAIILNGDSSKCSNIKMVSGIIHNYNTDKLGKIILSVDYILVTW